MRPTTMTSRRAVFDQATGFIDADPGGPASLDELAAAVAVSRRQLQRIFADVAGVTYRGYLTRARMDAAAALLRETSQTVREVAAAVGYSQPAQFAKAFRRQFGLAPNEFRRALDQRSHL